MGDTHVSPATRASERSATDAEIATSPSRWGASRVAALAIGVLLVLLSLVLLGVGGTALWADRSQRHNAYVTTDTHRFSSAGAALVTRPTHLGSAGVEWLYSPGLLGKVRIRVTPTNPASTLFVGVGHSADVDRYLTGVHRTVITEFFEAKAHAVDGGPLRSAPRAQRFWVASSTGQGARTLTWEPAGGSWRVVVMNADGQPGIDVKADLGARIPVALWIAIGFLAAGLVFLAGGALLIAGAVRRNGTQTIEANGGNMSTPSLTMPAPREIALLAERVDRYAGVKQYSLAQIVGVWAAAAAPMAILAWVVAPKLAYHLSGAGDVPMFKALNLILTVGLAWQFFLVAILVWQEQRTLRWSTIREALWLRSPRSPKTGKLGGKLWLIVIPLIVLTFIESLLPALGAPNDRDFGEFLGTDAGKQFLQGAWGWYALMLLWFVLNTVLGEELLFRGLLLPRMKRVFGRGDWAGNGVLFALYHLHMPWVILPTLAIDTFAIAYPSRRCQSALIGIAVHSAQSVFLAVILLTLVL